MGTGLTNLTLDPFTSCGKALPAASTAGGQGYPELGDTLGAGRGAQGLTACLQQYQLPARQPGFPAEGTTLPLL